MGTLIMRLRLNHTLGFISLVEVNDPTEVSETEEMELSYAKLDSVADQFTLSRHTHCLGRL